ncbi:integrase [Cytobacillus sp. Hz8]
MQEKSKSERRGELSKEEIRLISNDFSEMNYSLDDLIEIFIEDCELRNLREHTLKYYRNELNAFKNLLRELRIPLLTNEISGDVIKQNVILHMKKKGIKPVSHP